MVFAVSGSADKDYVALCIEEGAGGQFAHLAFVDRRVGEDELIQVFQHRELGTADAIADRSCLTMRAFRPDQAGDKWIYLVTPGEALAGDLVEAGAHAIEFEL